MVQRDDRRNRAAGAERAGARSVLARAALSIACVVLGAACTNNPYPEADDSKKVLYSQFDEAPKTLDPQVAYATTDHVIASKVYDTLLEYHYLKRPYELIPALAEGVPQPEPQADGSVLYRFMLRPDLWFQTDPCFSLSGGETRQMTAEDVAFALNRIGDPAVSSPVVDPFGSVKGFGEFHKALGERRKKDPAFAKKPAHEQYKELGGISGVVARSPRELDLTLKQPYPQILYWFAMPFTAPVPWEAVAYYDGETRDSFADHPVGTGAFKLVSYDKQARIVLEKNPNWYGIRHPEWKAPAATFPSEGGRAEDFKASWGKALPFIERIEYWREKESIPAFTKFLQGYYDSSGIVRESFDKVVRSDRLSPEMEALGMHLDKSVTPAIYYIGFNMDDPVVGTAGGERSRLLRQAMSLVTDSKEYSRLFMNGRGLPAQSVLPPGIFGFDSDYKNPFRTLSLERAKKLLVQAGYANGVDPKTGNPLKLTFDVPDTSPEGRLRFLFWVKEWRRLGIDVELAATTYNKFQEKVRDGAYQIFQWGWVADYPDPENFFFLLTTEMARSVSGGPNSANFKNAEFDKLFNAMKARENDAERLRLIGEMNAIIERDRPWIELFYPEDYALFHGWLDNVRPAGLVSINFVAAKYWNIDTELRAQRRAEWNQPKLWPIYLVVLGVVLIVVPGVLTFYRERQ
jgi:ABC-type transport system substrate-binding protein